MKLYSSDGSVLMEIKSIDRNGNLLEFKGTVMGSMPVKGSLSPEEAKKVFPLLRGKSLWWFLLTFIFRKSKTD